MNFIIGRRSRDEGRRLWIHPLQLTIGDLADEIHDTHHPIAPGLYYEEQKRQARRRARHFPDDRLAKCLGYFERVPARRHRRLSALGRTIEERPRIQAYLQSDRRLPLNAQGVFRHYPELENRMKVGN